MTKVLLTGFEPFAGARKNSSAEVIHWIDGQSLIDVRTAILPVEYQGSTKRLIELIHEIQPEVIISLGQAEGRSKISLERVAINLNDAQIADNAGEIRSERVIREGGSSAYFTPVPLKTLLDQVAPQGFPLEISLSAGSFVCNHVFYEVLRHIEQVGKSRELWMQFIHLPLVEEQSEEFPGKPTINIDLQGRAVTAIIEELKRLYLVNSSL